MNYRTTAVFILFLCIGVFPLSAQSFKLLRYNEDYYYLHKDSTNNWYNRIKYIPLSDRDHFYLSFGGEARYEYAMSVHEDWNRYGRAYNGILLQRYNLHADLHLGKSVRVFAQLSSALENFSKLRTPPINKDELAVQNLFIDVTLKTWPDKNRKLVARAGRQELDYGTGRLISVREGPNVRKYFNGGKVMYTAPKFGVDAFLMMDEEVKPYVFDNHITREANLWGTYAYIIVPAAGNLDLYYLGYRRDNAKFEEGIKEELRHTAAVRYWKYGGGFIYNLEAAYQFGSFGEGRISAWTTAIDIGYSFEHARFKPSINLRNDYISGDRKAGDGKLQTFNPLYPKGGYFGFNPRVGPANLIDLHPYGTLTFSDRFGIQADVVFNWRYSREDGIYRPSGSFDTGGSAIDGRYIGTAYLLSGDYVFSRFVKLSCGLQYFKTGPFINELVNPSTNSFFFNTQLSFKF
ncbi:alginate export family protein [Chitinophaga rhizophila]|uniref:Alginate export family protein n=1 Tax=Chitinophaga rhizophila TaxID=2866212 RepID=A0ABS7G9N3_9BACT|nr:alginate export family protein [Chitinophaga rhizophila]MBW8683840.1 alginate export family protein [Chitinophaga rhizophila]